MRINNGVKKGASKSSSRSTTTSSSGSRFEISEEFLTGQLEDGSSDSDEDRSWLPPVQGVGRGVNDLRAERSVTPSSARSGATTRSQRTAVSDRSNATSTISMRRRREASRMEALSSAAEPHPYGLQTRRSVTPLRASQSQSSLSGSSVHVIYENLVTSVHSQETTQYMDINAANNARTSVANNASKNNGRSPARWDYPFSSDSENSDGEDADRRTGMSTKSIFQHLWQSIKSMASTCCTFIYMSLMWVIYFEKWCLSSGKDGGSEQGGTSNEQRVNGHAYATHQQLNEQHAHGDQSGSYRTTLSSVLEYFRSFAVWRGRTEAGDEVLICHQETETVYGNQEGEEQESFVSSARSTVSSWMTISEETKQSFWKLCKLLLCLLLVIFFLYLLWVNGDYLVDSTQTCVAFLKSCAVGALSTIESVLTSTIGVLVSAPTAMVAKFRAQTVSVPVTVTPDLSSVKSERANVREPVAQIREPLPSVANVKLEETITNLKLKIVNIELKLQEYEKRLNKHDVDISSLETEINKVLIAMKAVSMKEKPIEQILEEVLSASIGETSEGTPVTLKSMFDLFKNEGDRERILLEINTKFGTISEHVANVEQESSGTKAHLDNMKIELSELNSRLHLMKSEVDEKWTETETKVDQRPEVDTDQLIKVILPVLKSEIEQKVAISCESRNCPDQSGFIGLGESDIELMIKRAIAKYDADKTGLPDLALEPAGGSILSTRCTKSSDTRNSVVSYWGFRLWSPPNTPRTIIQPGVVPGECWAFEGSVGDVVIKLALPSLVTGFTVEHIPKNLSRYNNIDSAPKNFQVLGLQSEHDTIEVHDYGTFTYEDNDEPLQYFPVANVTSKFYPIVELKILSNQGNLKYTCIYRFRVHGSIDTERSHGAGNIQNQNVIKD